MILLDEKKKKKKKKTKNPCFRSIQLSSCVPSELTCAATLKNKHNDGDEPHISSIGGQMSVRLADILLDFGTTVAQFGRKLVTNSTQAQFTIGLSDHVCQCHGLFGLSFAPRADPVASQWGTSVWD